MPVPQLPAEVWYKVMGYLRRPLPVPTGLCKREEIRQPDLVAAMRVSSLFNGAAALHLYRIVVADHLPLLVYNVNKPASALGIQSKRELLESVERLFLEYSDKDAPSYSDLLVHGRKLWVTCDSPIEDNLRMCEEEIDSIEDSCKLLHGIPKRLLSVSTGAFLGGQSHIWEALYLHNPPLMQYERTAEARYALTSLIVDPHLTYSCQRVQLGPLVVGPAIWKRQASLSVTSGPKTLQHSIHIGAESVDAPAVFGGVSRWYRTPPNKPTDDRDFEAIAAQFANILAMHISNRHRSFQFGGTRRDHPSSEGAGSRLSTDIYLPATMFEPEVLQYMQSTISENAELNYRTGRVPRAQSSGDDWRLKRLSDAPACEACGWAVGMSAYV